MNVMGEQRRQLWIGIAMDLMIAYHDAQAIVCSEVNHQEDPDVLIRATCERVAEAVGDDATADFVYEIVQRRLKEPR